MRIAIVKSKNDIGGTRNMNEQPYYNAFGFWVMFTIIILMLDKWITNLTNTWGIINSQEEDKK